MLPNPLFRGVYAHLLFDLLKKMILSVHVIYPDVHCILTGWYHGPQGEAHKCHKPRHLSNQHQVRQHSYLGYIPCLVFGNPYVYMYVYIYIYTRTYIDICVIRYTCPNISIHIYIYMYTPGICVIIVRMSWSRYVIRCIAGRWLAQIKIPFLFIGIPALTNLTNLCKIFMSIHSFKGISLECKALYCNNYPVWSIYCRKDIHSV